LLGNLDDAEDAVQDALMSAWVHIDSYRGAGSSGVRSWFMRIVFNRCTDLRRRASTRRQHETAAPERPIVLPDPRPEHRETLARVRAAIGALPPKQRAALHLRIMEDMTYKQIADVLDITPGTARVYMVRARSVLRDQLGEELP
jgi:RNA polymerase sigma-70 factor (ECF subfamily)